MAGIFSNILTRLHFQQILIQSVVMGIPNKYLATLTIMGLLIILGLFIDPAVLIVMFASTVYAAGNVLGFDPIHFDPRIDLRNTKRCRDLSIILFFQIQENKSFVDIAQLTDGIIH